MEKIFKTCKCRDSIYFFNIIHFLKYFFLQWHIPCILFTLYYIFVEEMSVLKEQFRSNEDD